MESKNNMKELFDEVIYAYTREQAIADGVLIDVSKMAKEAGIRFPVAVTSAVWHEYVVPDEELKHSGQSEDGRIWDTLWMFRCNATNVPTERQQKIWSNLLFSKSCSPFRQFLPCGYFYISAG